MTEVIGFYGFKGGAGRSLVLAHLAAMLAAEGNSVLIVDSDLEAPGLGDFFDQQGTTVFERWRQAQGLTDLMRDLAADRAADRMRTPADRDARIRARMEGSDAAPGLLYRAGDERPGLVRIGLGHGKAMRAQPAPIWLLGPGSHRAEAGKEAQSYVANFLEFDWNAFTRQGGDEILAALGAYLRGGAHGFDYILFDARTGYNFPSILFLQHFATKVVGVSTLSSQSIDGMARMLPVMAISQRADETIETFLVMNKGPMPEGTEGREEALPHVINDAKRALVARYFLREDREGAVFWLPIVEALQTHDSLVWAVETLEGYAASAARVGGAATPGLDEQLIWRAQDQARLFLSEMFRLYRRLRGADEASAGLDPAEPRLNDRLFAMFRVEKPALPKPVERSSGAPGQDFGQASGAANADPRTPKDLAAEEELAGEIARLILSNGLVDNEDGQERLEEGLRQLGEPGRVDVLRDAYVALDKDRRALVRSLVVGELRAAAEPADPEENGKRRLTIEEANARFFLDLEPTQAVAAVTGLEREDGPKLDLEEVWQAIREAARNPGGEAARERAARMAESALGLAGADREVAEFLAAYPMAVAGGATAPLAAAIGALAALVRARDGIAVPRTAEDFGRWNVYDLTGPALDAAGAAQAEDDGAAELLPELDELAGAMLARLADPAPWRAAAEEPDGVMRRRWQWASYVIQAVKARRLLRVHGPGKAPLDAVGLLSAEEAAALRAALSLPEPEAVTDWRWPDPVPVAAERAARMALETLLLTLEIEATQAPTSAMATLVAGLSHEILRNPMARFETEPGVASSRDEPQRWFRLVQRLAAMANSHGVNATNLRLLRRLSRLACQPGGTSVGARWAASSAVAAGMRFGADIPVALADDLAKAQALGEGASAAVAEAGFRAWPAATLCAEGRYRDALDLLWPLLEADRQGSSVDTALRYAHEAHARLGEVGQAERLRVRQRKRMVALSAPLAAVQTKLVAADLLHAQMGLDMGEPGERVQPILRDALETLARQDDAEACALRAEAEILLMLGGADAPEPDALTKRLETAMAPLMGVLPLGADRAAAAFGPLPWISGGLFPGTALHPGFDRWVARYLDPALCVLIDAGAETPARALLGRWRAMLARHDGVEDPAPAIHCARALAAAAAHRLDGRAEDRAAAEAGRAADCAANGDGRAALYVRAFAAAGIA